MAYKRNGFFVKAPKGLCEIICLLLPTVPLLRVEGGVSVRLRCSKCCSTTPLSRNSSSEWPMWIQIIHLKSSAFHPRHNLGSHAYTAAPEARLTGEPRKPVVSHGTGTLPRTSPNNVILLHKHHTHTLASGAKQRGLFLPRCLCWCCVCMCVLVCGLAARGMPSSLSPCVECFRQSRPHWRLLWSGRTFQ